MLFSKWRVSLVNGWHKTHLRRWNPSISNQTTIKGRLFYTLKNLVFHGKYALCSSGVGIIPSQSGIGEGVFSKYGVDKDKWRKVSVLTNLANGHGALTTQPHFGCAPMVGPKRDGVQVSLENQQAKEGFHSGPCQVNIHAKRVKRCLKGPQC